MGHGVALLECGSVPVVLRAGGNVRQPPAREKVTEDGSPPGAFAGLPSRADPRMGIAARIRALRIRAGKSQADMAQRLDLNIAWYADLEKRDDELASTLTLFKAMELASIFGVTLPELMDEPAGAVERVELIELPGRIKAHLKRNGISIGQLEEQVGWELQDFLGSPIQSAAELPIGFLQALAATLGINWLALIPDETAG